MQNNGQRKRIVQTGTIGSTNHTRFIAAAMLALAHMGQQSIMANPQNQTMELKLEVPDVSCRETPISQENSFRDFVSRTGKKRYNGGWKK